RPTAVRGRSAAHSRRAGCACWTIPRLPPDATAETGLCGRHRHVYERGRGIPHAEQPSRLGAGAIPKHRRQSSRRTGALVHRLGFRGAPPAMTVEPQLTMTVGENRPASAHDKRRTMAVALPTHAPHDRDSDLLY